MECFGKARVHKRDDYRGALYHILARCSVCFISFCFQYWTKKKHTNFFVFVHLFVHCCCCFDVGLNFLCATEPNGNRIIAIIILYFHFFLFVSFSSFVVRWVHYIHFYEDDEKRQPHLKFSLWVSISWTVLCIRVLSPMNFFFFFAF